ncbi:acyl-CoA reductase [Acutalibacter sp.]|uniref:acyl-CoA reductase n=1 Tax=Acutalibacter sp. TaxID=1918636 RepID=UPI0034DF7EC9
MLLHDPVCRAYPDVMSFAFWCRKGNLQRLQGDCTDKGSRLGRGLAFHVAPSNVPVNFAFSFAFSLLAGNGNIVRAPSKPFPQVERICNAIKEILPHHPEVEKRTAFMRYPVNQEITKAFCAEADARLIWGGDETVQAVRGCPVKPKCVDIVFADRYSLCVLDGNSILQADEKTLQKLAEGFYNDTYLMDQNACSSPHLVLWTTGTETARERFWEAVAEYAARYDLQGMTVVDKFTQMCQDAVDCPEVQKVLRQGGNLLYRAELSSLPENIGAGLRGRGGYFYEADLNTLEGLCPIVNEKYQTLTYFGVEAEKLQEMVMKNCLRGIDRIVPVGKAMDIGIVWDGYDIIGILSRIIQTA